MVIKHLGTVTWPCDLTLWPDLSLRGAGSHACWHDLTYGRHREAVEGGGRYFPWVRLDPPVTETCGQCHLTRRGTYIQGYSPLDTHLKSIRVETDTYREAYSHSLIVRRVWQSASTSEIVRILHSSTTVILVWHSVNLWISRTEINEYNMT